MELYTKEYFQKLAKQLMFTLTEEEAEGIVEEFKVLQQQLELLEAIDTEGVEEMIYPFEAPTSFMREDEVEHVLTQEEALANVSNKYDQFVVLPRVVK
ncbi:MAG: Asp-tRNA(Asn)/Glu-tRNA(Gln) amidotransferase subunit GatC [Erysipelotrichaceae bacterium]|nr:Asp-tRNA(Asn)/Glu-tRNA(Gln) amidotransferase subunit GatC [Erysipelotrichaceae bacterium]